MGLLVWKSRSLTMYNLMHDALRRLIPKATSACVSTERFVRKRSPLSRGRQMAAGAARASAAQGRQPEEGGRVSGCGTLGLERFKVPQLKFHGIQGS